MEEVDQVLWAVGRRPQTDVLDCAAVGLELDRAGNVVVDQFQNTNLSGVYALGDVAGKVNFPSFS